MSEVIAREKPPPVEASDEELVRRVAAGETELFELLMRRHNRKVYRAVRSVLRDAVEVEDAMQQAYLSAFANLASFAGTAKFSTWLVRIAINEALGRVRRAHRLVLVDEARPQRYEAAMTERRPNPEQNAANRELGSLLERAVDALPDMYRTVFMLRQIEGLNTLETAMVLGTSEDVVKTRLHRARALLHATLASVAEDHLQTAFAFDGADCDRMVARVFAALPKPD